MAELYQVAKQLEEDLSGARHEAAGLKGEMATMRADHKAYRERVGGLEREVKEANARAKAARAGGGGGGGWDVGGGGGGEVGGGPGGEVSGGGGDGGGEWNNSNNVNGGGGRVGGGGDGGGDGDVDTGEEQETRGRASSLEDLAGGSVLETPAAAAAAATNTNTTNTNNATRTRTPIAPSTASPGDAATRAIVGRCGSTLSNPSWNRLELSA